MNKFLEKSEKCILVIPSLEGGGAEKVFADLYNYLIKKKYDVKLILFNFQGKNLSKIKNKINLVNLKTKRASRSIPKLLWFLLLNRPSIAVSAMTHTNIVLIVSCLLYKIISRNNIKIIISERAPINFLFPLNKKFHNRFFRFLIIIFYKFTDKIITVSDGVKSELIKDYGINKEKILTIMNPVDLDDHTLTQELNKPFLWFKENFPTGISIGRLSKEKGFDTLLIAIKEVNKFFKYRHIICGIGKEKENLVNQSIRLNIQDKIYFADYVKEINIWLRNSDVFVISSRWEGCPNVILEALACNIPVISTNCPYGPGELLQKGKWGKLVDVDSVGQISQAIIDVIEHPIKENKDLEMYLRKNFSKDVIFKKYEKVIFSI